MNTISGDGCRQSTLASSTNRFGMAPNCRGRIAGGIALVPAWSCGHLDVLAVTAVTRGGGWN